MTGYLYIRRCADGSYYVGSTTDLEVRPAAHASGEGSDFTSSRRPLEPAYTEEFHSLDGAFIAERQVKGWSRRTKQALIRGDFAALPELAWSSARRAAAGVLRQAQDETLRQEAQDGVAEVRA